MNQDENWLKQPLRKRGLEIDCSGVPKRLVYFYGNAPRNVIVEPIPLNLKNPQWNEKAQKWEELE